MNTEILVASISGIVAVLIAAIAYIQSKKLTFFETFFKRKADAFEEYIYVVSSVPKTEKELYNVSSVTRKAILYCFEVNKETILDMLDLMIKAYQSRTGDQIPEEIQKDFREQRKIVVKLLRNEIQKSQKFIFK
ncbi:MAG: hypothetical protein PHE51_12040 [Eubacteriales bacterium]|nr:hypothetical protein [Eubacteriales bacterium]